MTRGVERALIALLAVAASWSALADGVAERLVSAARERTRHHEIYDGSYRRIGYPMGDVADDRGVCSDLVIRAYRRVGFDLQVAVHEDMMRHFSAYPANWGLRRPDPNIDHRRVPNLQRFLKRTGAAVPVTAEAGDYHTGDLVTWMLPGNLPHIGIVSDRKVWTTGRPKVIHNVGAGPVEDDSLFRYPITGHYRWDAGRQHAR